MFLQNLLMAIILALFFLSFLHGLSKISKTISEKRQGIIAATVIVKYIFFGLVLNVLLTLLGLTEFNFSDIFLCICLVIFKETV